MKAATHTRTVRRAVDPPRPYSADVDPDLERQLLGATRDQQVEAVLVLRRDAAGAPCLDAPDALLKRVCGGEPAALDSHYLPRLGVLIVRACPDIIRRLLEQPEVAVACPNRTGDGDADGGGLGMGSPA
jgi:hypothetical protein